jgi:hypothetical protein
VVVCCTGMREFSLLRGRGLRRPNYAAHYQFIAWQHMSRAAPAHVSR